MGKNVENEPPVTVPDLIMSAATKYSHYLAIGSKYKKNWQLLTYIEYYEACRRAAKAFLKVLRLCLRVRTPPTLPAAWGRVRWLLSPSTSGCLFTPLRVTPAISHVDYLPLSVSSHKRVILHSRPALM